MGEYQVASIIEPSDMLLKRRRKSRRRGRRRREALSSPDRNYTIELEKIVSTPKKILKIFD